MLSVRDVAEELSIPLSTAYKLAHTMPHFRVGRSIRIARKAFDAWLNERACAPVTERERPAFVSKSAAAAFARCSPFFKPTPRRTARPSTPVPRRN